MRASRARRAAARSTITCSMRSADQAGHAHRRRLLRPIRPRGELALSGLSRRACRRRQRLHGEGVRSIIIAGQVPTWAPVLPILVGRDVLEHGEAAEFARSASGPTRSRPTGTLAAKDWGEGVRYVSQAAKLCGADGCRRLIGEKLPEDLLAVDYGHYSARARSSPSKPSSRRSSTPNWRGWERTDRAAAPHRRRRSIPPAPTWG